jgi:hypothetical protein
MFPVEFSERLLILCKLLKNPCGGECGSLLPAEKRSAPGIFLFLEVQAGEIQPVPQEIGFDSDGLGIPRHLVHKKEGQVPERITCRLPQPKNRAHQETWLPDLHDL